MSDRDKVIKELMFIKRDYIEDSPEDQTIDKAITLLKAQGPVKPERSGRNLTWYYCCGACGQPIDPGDPYCRKCGRKVNWDD